jgi:replicative DNA helicase
MIDNDSKKIADKQAVTDSQSSYPSVTPQLPSATSVPTPKGYKGLNYFTTEEVAKIIDVTKQAVIKWRKLGWFKADLVTHDGVYLYSIEHVEQLKAVYRRDWQKAWRGETTTDSEKKSVPELFAEVEKRKTDWKSRAEPTKLIAMTDYFAHHLKADIDALKNYANRSTGFDNLDRLQTFNPGLYVIGATPAAGKTTFCWQLLEQLAERGEKCIYCSYEMGVLELFTKTAARKLFLRDRQTNLTAAEIRRGGWSAQLDNIVEELGNAQTDLQILSLQDESIDDLLSRLKPLCADKAKAPMVCLDYLQIVPTSRDSIKLGVDDSVRKLKKFQRDTNTTFIVISSFNRANYTQTVSFESFKESGNIEYTADVVWALQLNILNAINPGNISDARKKIEAAKKQQPRQIILKCLKNRQGTNYECFFKYYSAHDCFEPCTKADFKLNDSADNNEYDID